MFSLYLPYIKKLLGIGKKIILVVLVYFVIIALFSHFINKDKTTLTSQISPIEKNRAEIYKLINDKQLNKTKEGKTSIAVYKAIACGAIGEACTNNPADGNKNFKNSLFGFMSNLIVMPYANPPASGVYWAYSGLQNAGFVPKTYAAEGIGFGALKPFMNLWKVFRDISYMLLVLVLVAIGFMIMFRAKINPQTVISVENALPKIVISLLLITFSFAIAGFLIDLMYVIIALSISVLSNRGNFFNATEFMDKYTNPGFGQVWEGMFPGKSGTPVLGSVGNLMVLSQALINILPDVVNQVLRLLLGAAGLGLMVFFVDPKLMEILKHAGDLARSIPVGDSVVKAIILVISIIIFLIISPFLGFGLGYSILPLVIFIFIAVTVLFLLLRIFFLLFSTYLKILIMIIFAPLFLLFEAIPGKSAFSFWFKNLLAEILVFPLVVLLFLVGYVIVNTTASVGTLWRPPFLSDLNPAAFTILLGMGLIFMIPDLVKIFKELIGAKGLPATLSLGTFFGGAGALIGGVGGGMGMFTSLTQMPIIGKRIMESDLYQKAIKAGVLPPTQAELFARELEKRGIGKTP